MDAQQGKVVVVGAHCLEIVQDWATSCGCPIMICYFANSKRLDFDAFLSKVITFSQP